MIIYTVGDRQHGMGHVMRCLTLAGALRKRNLPVSFVTTSATPGQARMLQAGYVVHEARSDMDWSIQFQMERACLIDIENGPPREMLEAARPHFDLLVVVNGSGYMLHDRQAVRELSDLRIYQSLFDEVDPRSLSGVQHIIIDPRYAECRPDHYGPIVVSLGGSDPHNLTQLVVDALRPIKREVIVINGTAANGIANAPRNMTLLNAPSSLVDVFNGASLYIGALGMTAYEAAAAGVPSLLTAWSTDHERTAQALEERDVCRSLGVWGALDIGRILTDTNTLLDDAALWRKMSAAGTALVDGQGVRRVADALARMVNLVEV